MCRLCCIIPRTGDIAEFGIQRGEHRPPAFGFLRFLRKGRFQNRKPLFGGLTELQCGIMFIGE